MDNELVARGINLLRAIEANARINLVLFRELQEGVIHAAEAELGPIESDPLLMRIMDLIDELEKFHEEAEKMGYDHDIEIPEDDGLRIIMTPQSFGGK